MYTTRYLSLVRVFPLGLGGALRRIHSYGVLLWGDPGDSGPEEELRPAEELREAGSNGGGGPGKSAGLKPSPGATDAGTGGG